MPSSVSPKGAVIAAHRLGKVYGESADATEAVHDLTFEIDEGEFVCLCGPSGCGKTTLLRCMSGLQRPTEGEVVLDGSVIEGPPRDMALVFQDYSRSLMPWMRVAGNVGFPLHHRGVGNEERRRLVTEALCSVGLDGLEDRYPWQLSGGMQQRVAIARALAYQPRILLMDEPFASVDAQTRADLEDLILDVKRQYEMTVLFVTHDVDEAVYLADRVIVLSPRPASVAEIVDVDLPSPRDQVTSREVPAFARLRSHVFSAIMRREADGPKPRHTAPPPGD